MSELIDNHQILNKQQKLEQRETLKNIIRSIRTSEEAEEVKKRFADLLEEVGPLEIARIEQELINEGMPVDEVKSLCDVHTQVFAESLEQQQERKTEEQKLPPEEQGGHPVHTFKKENRAVEGVMQEIRLLLNRILAAETLPEITTDLKKWQELHDKLSQIDIRFTRKENILFAYLDKHGITGPSSVMWGIQDDIRAELKQIGQVLAGPISLPELKEFIEKKVRPALQMIDDLIYKEENIMLPTALEVLSEGEWVAIAQQGEEIGYTLITPDTGWNPSSPPEPVAAGVNHYGYEKEEGQRGTQPLLPFETGILTLEQVSLIFNHLPIDITFVDAEDKVRYFSNGPERLFQRTKAIIGRDVKNCHPPDSVHIVEKILTDFKSGIRDSADFWIHMHGKFIYIRYFAVRDHEGKYAGCLEVTQEISKIRELQGEKRIYTEE